MTKITIDGLWEQVTEGKYLALNGQGCSVSGDDARAYNPEGFTLVPVDGFGPRYHTTRNRRVQRETDFGTWAYI